MSTGDSVLAAQEDARQRLTAVGAAAREVTGCPACLAPAGWPCPGSPDLGHKDRIVHAANMLGYPPDFMAWSELVAAAYPLPADTQPHIARSGRTVLWRAAQARHPYFGRGSYWTHDRQWAETYATAFSVDRTAPVPYIVYRTSVLIDPARVHHRDAIGQREVDQAIDADPLWPGGDWLLFRDPDPHNTRPAAYKSLLQYVWCGDKPLHASPVARYVPAPEPPPMRRTPPLPSAGRQWSVFGPWVYDINGGERLLAASPRNADRIPVAPFIRAYAGYFRGKSTGFDPQHAMTSSDPAQPVLVVTLQDTDVRYLPPAIQTTLPRDADGRLLVVADGKHRLWRAFAENLPTIPGYVLTPSETLAIRGTASQAPSTWNPRQHIRA